MTFQKLKTPDLKRMALLGLALPAMALAFTPAAFAQTGAAETPSAEALTYARLLGAHCPGAWESDPCLSAISKSNLALASNYGAKLQENKQNDAAENIKQLCAASTAAAEGSYPAYAMKSAFIECANAINDTANKTRIDPDKSHYQLLVGATLCLNKDAGCESIAKSLQGYAAQ